MVGGREQSGVNYTRILKVRSPGPSMDGRQIKRVDDNLFLTWIDPPVPWFQPEIIAVFLAFGSEALRTRMSFVQERLASIEGELRHRGGWGCSPSFCSGAVGHEQGGDLLWRIVASEQPV